MASWIRAFATANRSDCQGMTNMAHNARVGQVARDADQLILAQRSARTSWPRRLGRLARQKPLGTIAVLILMVMWLSAACAPWVAPFYWRDVFSGPRLQS